MNVLSLFDGMSCGQIALERAGIQVDNYYASEIDKYAIGVTQANYPHTIQLGDVRNVKAVDLPRIDLLLGGSPCQGFSAAGKGLNFEDPRSKLFFEYVRLLKECQPTWFLLENVKMKAAYRDIISEWLGVQPIEIDSALVSAQSRKRLYWTNIPVVGLPTDCDIPLSDIIESGYVDRNKAYCCRSGGGLTGNSNRHRYFSKAFGQYKFTKDVSMLQDKEKLWENYEVMIPFSMLEMERLQTVPDNYTCLVSDTQRYKMLGNGWTVDVIAWLLSFIKQ